MPYAQEISRTHSALFVLLIDQSSSMAEPLADSTLSRRDGVALAVNGWLSDLVAHSFREEGIQEWLDIAVIGFRTDEMGTPIVESAFAGDLAGRDRVSIAEVAEHPIVSSETGNAPKIEQDVALFSAQRPFWITTKAQGGTPTCTALVRAHEIASHWINEHPESFPPVVILVTDGESQEGDPVPYAESLTRLATSDGHVLLFTCFLDASEGPAKVRQRICFPESSESEFDAFLRSLVILSSRLPEPFVDRLRTWEDLNSSVSTQSRGCVLYAGLTDLQRLLGLLAPIDLGTRAVRQPEVDRGQMPAVSTESESLAKPYLDENVQFTTYCPSQIPPEQYKPLLVFAHLEELPPDADADEPDPVEEVRRQAQTLLGEAIVGYRESTHESRQAIPRESELTFVVAFDGLRCNPPRHTVFWEEPVHRVEFRLKAPASLENQICRGQLTVFLGDLLIAQADLRVKVSAAQSGGSSRPQRIDVRPYRRIFASYSRRDLPMVEQFERYAAAMGDRYLRDLVDLRAGEEWNAGLERMIREADVFQLFWSHNSMKSEFCRQEWEFALSLQRPNFIRPTYWEQPFPEDRPHLPPEELQAKHFQLLGRYVPVAPVTTLPNDSAVVSAPSVEFPTIEPTGAGSHVELPSLQSLETEDLADESRATDQDLEFGLDDGVDWDKDVDADATMDLETFDESELTSPGDTNEQSFAPEAFEDEDALDSYEDEFDDEQGDFGESFSESDGVVESSAEVISLDDECDYEFEEGLPLGSPGIEYPFEEQGDELSFVKRLGIFVLCAIILMGGIIGIAVMTQDKEPEVPDVEVRCVRPVVRDYVVSAVAGRSSHREARAG